MPASLPIFRLLPRNYNGRVTLLNRTIQIAPFRRMAYPAEAPTP